MADLPFVDTHIHLWDRAHPALEYDWLEPGVRHDVLGDIEHLKVVHWEAEHFRLETERSNVLKTVHIQCAAGSVDPVAETLWLDEAATRHGIPDAIVAHTDLKSPRVEAELEKHCMASARLRGIRDFSCGDFLADPGYARGCAALERHELVLDLNATWEDMPKARDLAAKIPNTPVILEHVGFPRDRTPEYFANWRGGLWMLAEAPNAWCKISGLGLCDNHWDVTSIKPWVLAAIEIFGVERCVMGSDWPVDKLFSNYDAVLEAYSEILEEFSESDRIALFSANAERVYRI
jgi:predicted TIM-barrel fold metal-dependent hydrolase